MENHVALDMPVEQEQHVEPDLTFKILKFTTQAALNACINWSMRMAFKAMGAF